MTPNKKNYDGKIPFLWHEEFQYLDGTVREAHREQLAYESYHVDDWMDNKMFTATLEFLSMSRGRSAANFEGVLRDVGGWDMGFRTFLEGCHVNIFMTDMLDIVKKTDISHGITSDSLWTFCKRGSNYGLRWVANAR